MSDWRDRAACRDVDPELFFPPSEIGPGADQIVEAKAVCRRCPVVAECLSQAMGEGQNHGVWGAMSSHERRAWKRSGAEFDELLLDESA